MLEMSSILIYSALFFAALVIGLYNFVYMNRVLKIQKQLRIITPKFIYPLLKVAIVVPIFAAIFILVSMFVRIV